MNFRIVPNNAFHFHYAVQKKNIIYYIYYNHRHNSCVKSNPKIMGTFVSCVWKKGQENWIFFSNKNGPERGRRIHAQCVQWFLASLHPTPTIYTYIYFVWCCSVYNTEIPQMWKKAEQIYEWTLYIYVWMQAIVWSMNCKLKILIMN